MNLPQVARLIARFAGLFSLAQAPALVVALSEERAAPLSPTTGFVTSLAAGLAAATLLSLIGRRDRSQIFRRETIAVAGLSWFLAGIIGAVPFWASGLLTPVDAIFEAMSGLTTCGATVLGSGGNLDIEAVPQSLLLWRAMLQWIGGAGIVLIFVALLPAVGVSAKNLLSSELCTPCRLQLRRSLTAVATRATSRCRAIVACTSGLRLGISLIWSPAKL